jgi:hypothetical protein
MGSRSLKRTLSGFLAVLTVQENNLAPFSPGTPGEKGWG